MIRLASTAADFESAARQLETFNAEFGDPCPDPAWLAQRFGQLITTGDSFIVLASADAAGEPNGPDIGFGLARLRPQYYSDSLECYLAELYIEPTHRGEGHGRALLQAVIDEAAQRGATYIDLNTSETDVDARRLYERFGFDCHEGEGPGGPLCLYYERDL